MSILRKIILSVFLILNLNAQAEIESGLYVSTTKVSIGNLFDFYNLLEHQNFGIDFSVKISRKIFLTFFKTIMNNENNRVTSDNN